MSFNFIEITAEGTFISKYRGFFKLEKTGKEVLISSDNVEAIVVTAFDAVISKNTLIEAAERSIPIIFCDKSYLPQSIAMPLLGLDRQAGILVNQVKAAVKLKQRLWQKIIKHKILLQSEVLKKLGKDYLYLQNLSKEVREDDSSNCEGRAAAFYFKELFGKNFRRLRDFNDCNSFLNYGYTILRSSVCRGIALSGLNPSIGIKHSGATNPFCLADDIMEIFRPIIDWYVYNYLLKNGLDPLSELDLNSDAKKEIALAFKHVVETVKGEGELIFAIHHFCYSVRDSFELAKVSLSPVVSLGFSLI